MGSEVLRWTWHGTAFRDLTVFFIRAAYSILLTSGFGLPRRERCRRKHLMVCHEEGE